MTAAEHYSEGERLLASAGADGGNSLELLAAAQAHFSAAQVGATLTAALIQVKGGVASRNADDLYSVAVDGGKRA